jgi:hypothetical protein
MPAGADAAPRARDTRPAGAAGAGAAGGDRGGAASAARAGVGGHWPPQVRCRAGRCRFDRITVRLFAYHGRYTHRVVRNARRRTMPSPTAGSSASPRSGFVNPLCRDETAPHRLGSAERRSGRRPPGRSRAAWRSGRRRPRRPRAARAEESRAVPARKALASCSRKSGRNSLPCAFTDRKKPVGQAIQRVPSDEGPPPMQWTCG